MRSRTAPSLALAAAVALALGACTTSGDSPEEEEDPAPAQGEVSVPAEPTAVAGGQEAHEIALGASEALFASAPVAVVADGADADAQLRGASAAVALGAPMLLTGDDAALAAELERLGAQAVLAVGDVGPAVADSGAETPEGGEESTDAGDGGEPLVVVPAPEDDAALAELLGTEAGAATAVDGGTEVSAVAALERSELALLTPGAPASEPPTEDATPSGDGATETAETADAAAEGTTEPGGDDAIEPGGGDATEPTEGETPAELPATTLPEPVDDVLVMSTGSATDIAAVATARAAGAEVLLVPSGDPRATSETVQAVAGQDPAHVVGLGDAFGDAETLGWRTATAATGVELPGGGQLVFPGKRYVALYGTPSTTALGVLGEQDVAGTIQRAAEHAEPYQEFTDDTVIPALEIIATVAAAQSGSDGNYSNELPVEELRPLVEAAGEAGQYVVLDLQPGRTSFVEQAQLYAELLALPHVGLALDPEWNLGPDEVHMVQIGTVTSEEINEVVDWLADFTRENLLPQKLLVLHQFQVRMIQEVSDVDTSRTELAVLVHADGQGGQPAKQGTWATLRANAPNIEWWGWKNFYDEDIPMLTPAETAQVEPMPHFVSYQ